MGVFVEVIGKKLGIILGLQLRVQAAIETCVAVGVLTVGSQNLRVRRFGGSRAIDWCKNQIIW
jgi:hypothetical protein